MPDSLDTPELTDAASYSVEVAKTILADCKLFVMTGAGVSTDSGIPDYRGAGRVARHPMTYDIFVGSTQAQQRYWARSYVGWSRIAMAKPNSGHFALAKAESAGRLQHLITQNVDRLHQSAGSENVIDLHGRLDQVICLRCQAVMSREQMDHMLRELNPGIARNELVEFTPDGDAEIEGTEDFIIPSCASCQGVLKPDVVFFGESVPAERVESAMEQLQNSDAVLVAGSSLTVNSGFRFAKQAVKLGKPLVIVNIGPTRADDLALAKIEANTSVVLERLLND